LFMRRADRNFVLRAKGRTDVSCQVSQNFYTHRSRNLCELEVVIPTAAYGKMAQGVEYTLHPVNGKPGDEWKVREGVKLTRRQRQAGGGSVARGDPLQRVEGSPDPLKRVTTNRRFHLPPFLIRLSLKGNSFASGLTTAVSGVRSGSSYMRSTTGRRFSGR